jgi:hypothetical protein
LLVNRRLFWAAVPKDSNADKFAAVKAALAEKKGIRRSGASSKPVSAQCCGLKPNWRPEFISRRSGMMRSHALLLSAALSVDQRPIPQISSA